MIDYLAEIDQTDIAVLLTIVLCCTVLLAVGFAASFWEDSQEPYTYTKECIEKLEAFAGENTFDIYACERDIKKAEKIRREQCLCQ